MPDSQHPGDLSDLWRRGFMLIFSSPSGAGKTSIANGLLERNTKLTISVSATTRDPRPGEVEGKHYYFIDEEDFRKRVKQDEFLEHAEVFGNFYGTPEKPVNEALAQGKDVLFDIDWQGARQLSKIARDDIVTVFVLPPSWAELEHRLRKRDQDSEETIRNRMSQAADEIRQYFDYDYVIINRDLEKSIGKAQAILDAERLKRKRLVGLRKFVNTLLEGEEAA